MQVTHLQRHVADFHARLADDARAIAAMRDSSAVERRLLVAPRYLQAREVEQQAVGGALTLRRDGTSQADEAWVVLRGASRARRTIAQATGVAERPTPATTIAAADDASARRSRTVWDAAANGRSMPLLRLHSGVRPRDAKLVASTLAQVPQSVVDMSHAANGRMYLFTGTLTDIPGARALRDKPIRGWPAGSTWDQSPGFGWPRTYGTNPQAVVDVRRERPGIWHSERSLSLHELGHAVDQWFAPPGFISASSTDAWLRGSTNEARLRATLGSYYLDHPSEWFGEALVG